MEKVLNVDPEFQGKIPPLTEQEFAQLEENILEAGRVYEPIVVWNGTIVDGHNRYKIVQKHPGIIWETREMNFDDKWAAFDWMYKNQLGRRNLTAEQRTYLLGKLYEARKHCRGANQFTVDRRDQNDLSSNGRVYTQIAKEQGVGSATVKRAEIFARGIDAIRKEDPELAEDILTAKNKIPMESVRNIAKASKEKKSDLISAVKLGKHVIGGRDPKIVEPRADMKAINATMERMKNTEDVDEFTVENLVGQIRVNSDAFIRTISNILMDHTDLCNENRIAIITVIDECINQRIDQIKERLNNGKQL